ncbi:MAG TPA: flagellar export chaperone FliS [Gammaproteobacteria bacterium]|nr:flagellar export chaperone FliS [Gammaproteobacteria bacterium]
MSYIPTQIALQQYNQVRADAGVAYANPHKLIQMLFEGALDKIANAKGCMLRAEIAQKGALISDAISIVEGLRVSLDKSAGGELAQHLDNLYGYMESRLLRANYENNPALLDEVCGLLREVKSAWDAIPDSIIQTSLAGQQLDQQAAAG